MQTALASTGLSLAPNAALLRGIPTVRPAAEAPALGSTRCLAKDEAIFAEGDRAVYFYKVVSGALRTSKLLSDGRRQIDAFHLPGDIFGIESGDEHRFTAEALGSATVIAYRRCSLDALASGDAAFSRQIVAAMMRSLERAQDHMLLLGRKSAMEKIATFLLDMAERFAGIDHVDLPMSRTDIADHLGLTIETVSRSLTQLERGA